MRGIQWVLSERLDLADDDCVDFQYTITYGRFGERYFCQLIRVFFGHREREIDFLKYFQNLAVF